MQPYLPMICLAEFERLNESPGSMICFLIGLAPIAWLIIFPFSGFLTRDGSDLRRTAIFVLLLAVAVLIAAPPIVLRAIAEKQFDKKGFEEAKKVKKPTGPEPGVPWIIDLKPSGNVALSSIKKSYRLKNLRATLDIFPPGKTDGEPEETPEPVVDSLGEWTTYWSYEEQSPFTPQIKVEIPNRRALHERHGRLTVRADLEFPVKDGFSDSRISSEPIDMTIPFQVAKEGEWADYEKRRQEAGLTGNTYGKSNLEKRFENQAIATARWTMFWLQLAAIPVCGLLIWVVWGGCQAMRQQCLERDPSYRAAE